MTLQENIRNIMKTAMKDGDTELRDFLRVVLGEFSRIEKEITDEQALKIIKKLYDNAVELNNEFEQIVLIGWVPIMLNETELKNEIEVLIIENNLFGLDMTGKTMGLLQSHPKKNMMDMKIASKLVKEILLKEE